MKKLLNLSLFVLVLLIGWQISVQSAHAGTNLTVVCNNEGPCTTSPNAPLFSETNLIPGETRSQTITIINNDSDDTCQIGLGADDSEIAGFDLSEKLYAAVTADGTNFVGIVNANAATNALTYDQLIDTISQYNLGQLSPGSSRTYTWFATFDKDAGNEYQGLSSNFEIVLGFTCDTPQTSAPGPAFFSTSSNGGGGGGGTGGGDVPQSFSVLGAVTNQAIALGGQILGTGTNTPEISEMTLDETPGEVAGAISDVCSNWKQYLPWILLVVQTALIIILELLFRHRKSNMTAWALAASVTMISIALFYVLRECNCFNPAGWQYRLCQWYWLVATALALVTKLLGHRLLHSEK